MVCRRWWWQSWCVCVKDGVWQSCVCERWCVTKRRVKDGGWQSCVWKMVGDKVVGKIGCDKVVCERWCVWQRGVWRMVWWKMVKQVVCERWCVTKRRVKDGGWQSCLWKMVGDKVVGKMVCDKVVCERWWVKDCVWQSCVWKMVCDKVVCERWCVTKRRRRRRRRWRRRRRRSRDTESKTRTPRKDAGNKRQGARTNQNNEAICAVSMQDTHKIWWDNPYRARNFYSNVFQVSSFPCWERHHAQHAQQRSKPLRIPTITRRSWQEQNRTAEASELNQTNLEEQLQLQNEALF